MKEIQEIKELITQINPIGVVEFTARLSCKMSPHSPPVILYKVSVTDDFEKMSKPVLWTIIQRLKIMIYENNKSK